MWEFKHRMWFTEILNRQMLHSANLKKQSHRKTPELCFYRNRNRNEIGASCDRRSNIGVFDIRIDLDHNMIHQKGKQWLPALVWPEDIWSTTPIKKEDLIENVDRMRVGCLFEKKIRLIELEGLRKAHRLSIVSDYLAHSLWVKSE